MNKFSPEVCKKLNYYVYRLIDPRNGETFYIGKGYENRVFNHMEMEIKFDKNSDEMNEYEVTEKFKILREIRNEGLKPIHIIHRHGMNEEEAFEVEAAQLMLSLDFQILFQDIDQMNLALQMLSK